MKLKMGLPEVKRRLEDAGLTVVSERQVQKAWQLRLDTGGIVNVYDNGTVLCQGIPEAHAALDKALDPNQSLFPA